MTNISSQQFYSPTNLFSSTGLTGVNERLSTRNVSTSATQTLNSNASDAQTNSARLSSYQRNPPTPNIMLRAGEQISLSTGQPGSEPPSYAHLSKTLTPEKLNLDDFSRSLNNLSGLTGLTGLTQSYAGTARTYGPLEAINNSEHVQNKAGNWVATGAARLGNLLSLTIKTKEGDEIAISIDRSRGKDEALGYYSEMSIGFEVAGELDDDEQQALSALTHKLGGIAQNYRNNGWTSIGQLDIFDADELSGFSLSIAGIDKDSFNIDYAIDETAGERTLSANQNGYQYDLQVDIDGFMSDQDIANNAHYQQYMDLILTTSGSYNGGQETNQRTANFFLEGMGVLFQTSANAEGDAISPAPLAAEAKANQLDSPSAQQTIEESLDPLLIAHFGGDDGLLQRFSSGLADFTASFSTPILRPNPDKPAEISMMALNLAQTTSIKETINATATRTQVSQKSEFNATVRQHLGIAGGGLKSADLAAAADGGQTYRYRTEIQRGSMSRTLNFEDNETLASVKQSRDSLHQRTDTRVERGETTAKTTTDLTNRSDNTDYHFRLPRNSAELRLAEQQIADFRTLAQLEQMIDANQVTLFP